MRSYAHMEEALAAWAADAQARLAVDAGPGSLVGHFAPPASHDVGIGDAGPVAHGNDDAGPANGVLVVAGPQTKSDVRRIWQQTCSTIASQIPGALFSRSEQIHKDYCLL